LKKKSKAYWSLRAFVATSLVSSVSDVRPEYDSKQEENECLDELSSVTQDGINEMPHALKYEKVPNRS
jgi:hypothetical protein